MGYDGAENNETSSANMLLEVGHVYDLMLKGNAVHCMCIKVSHNKEQMKTGRGNDLPRSLMAPRWYRYA